MRTTSVAGMARLPSMRRRSGHTLVELVVSVAVSGILVAGMTSTLYVASRAVNTSGPSRSVLEASAAAADVLGELQYAITFTERSADAVKFSVADRTGDEVPETIRYAWSGTPGDPLTRQYNGGEQVEIVQDVRQFDLTYEYRQAEQVPPGGDESAEQLLLAKDTMDSGAGYSRAITSSTWAGTYFAPSLPAEANSWRITRIEIYAKYAVPSSGGVLLQVRTADMSLHPTDTILGGVPIGESALPKNFGWYEVSLGSVSGLSPAQGVCVVVRHEFGSGTVATLFTETHSAGDPTPAAHPVITDDGGVTWTTVDGQDMWIRVWGTYTTQSEPPSPPSWLASVGVQLRVGPDSATRIDGGVQVLNAPEVAAP